MNRYLKRMVIKANDEAGEKGVLLPNLHTHMLRKTCGCNHIRMGYGIEEVAKKAITLRITNLWWPSRKKTGQYARRKTRNSADGFPEKQEGEGLR